MGTATVLKRRFETVLGDSLEWQSRPAPQVISSGMPALDRAIGGLPRGALTEIVGPASSGRTALLIAVLAEATSGVGLLACLGQSGRAAQFPSPPEFCALIDAEDAFDPASAAAAGVRLERLLWVRCGHNAEHALQAADLLLQGGGFGMVAMDLGDTPPEMARRISLTSWFRLRRAVEHTPAVLLAVSRQSNAKTCSSLTLECARESTLWRGAPAIPAHARLLDGVRVHTARRKPGPAVNASFLVRTRE